MRVYLALLIGLMFVSSALAVEARSRDGMQNNSAGIGQELREQVRDKRIELKEGNFTGPMGQALAVRIMSANLRELREGNVSVRSELNITGEFDSENRTRLRARLKNESDVEIKIMPETASARALERLRLKNCNESNNCTIVLKEVGNGKNNSLAYNLQAERHSKLFGIFSKRMHVRAEVDADNGEVKLHKPWWAFIAVEKED